MSDSNNEPITEETYVPITERLQNLKTRLDNRDYNEQQQVLFTKICDGLDKDTYQKVCRFITDCDVPSLELCIVDTNYKTSVPPSHPNDPLPINLLASLQTCCEPGRIACPELIMYSIEPEVSIEDMMLHDCTDLSTGKLCVGIDFKNRVRCCESDEEFDFIEILPSIQLDYDCAFGSFEFSGEYMESVEICYKRLEFLRKYHLWLDICQHELSFEASIEPIAEFCLACDTNFETSAEASVENACGNLTVKVKKNVNIDWCSPEYTEEISIELSQECGDPRTYRGHTEADVYCLHGAYLKYKLDESATVDWCSGEVSLKPKLTAECRCNPIASGASIFPIKIEIPPCSQHINDTGLVLTSTGEVSHVLQPNGMIDCNVKINKFKVKGALGLGAGVSFVKDIKVVDNRIQIDNGFMTFVDGILCNVADGETKFIDISTVINCKRLRKRCRLCECSDSSSSSSSSSHSSSSGSGYSNSSSSGCPCYSIKLTVSQGHAAPTGATNYSTGEQIPGVTFTTVPSTSTPGSYDITGTFVSCEPKLDYCHVHFEDSSFITAPVTLGCEPDSSESSTSSSSSTESSSSSATVDSSSSSLT